VVSLWFVPVACLAAVPFLLSRPVFEGMGEGQPGMWMAALRYLVLAAPGALGGMKIAEALGYPGIYGLVVGMTLATVLTSLLFMWWLWMRLRTERQQS
jgi:Na+-driven multidrug efflux pump